MATLQAVLPAGSTFSGQLVYNSTDNFIDSGIKHFIESISITYMSKYVNKYTGFETKKYRIRNMDFSYDVDAEVDVMFTGDLTKKYQNLLRNLANSVLGGGMQIKFTDDIASDKHFTGRWVNSGDFVDNTELLCGASLQLLAFNVADI